MSKSNNNYLVISDLQIPFESPRALAFCKSLQDEYKIPKENIICVGDEVDHYFGSAFKKDVNARMSAVEEIELTRKKLRAWYREFPLMKIAVSNHGVRWAKKALEAEIPSVMLKQYQELLEAPRGWQWQEEIIVKTKHPWRVIHGMEYSGVNGHRNAAIDAGMSTAIGHIHSFGGISRIRTSKLNLWAMNTGCLINPNAFAFQYGKYSRMKPTLGCGLVLDDGRLPIWMPF